MAEKKPVETEEPNLGTFLKGDTVVIKVGPDHTKYNVHKALLTHHSDYFRRALTGKWKEAEEGIVVLEDVEPHVFDVFVYLLYGGILPTLSLAMAVARVWYRIAGIDPKQIEGYETPLLLQFKLYVFCDRVTAVELKRAVRNNIVSTNLFAAPKYLAVIHAFENLPSDDSMLDFLVEIHCNNYEPSMDGDSGDGKLIDRLPRDYLARIMKRHATCACGEDDNEGIFTKYHEHHDSGEKWGCKYCRDEMKARD